MIALQSIPGFIVCLHVAIGPAFRQHHGVSSATVSTQVLTWWYCHGCIDDHEQAAEEYNNNYSHYYYSHYYIVTIVR